MLWMFAPGIDVKILQLYPQALRESEIHYRQFAKSVYC